MRPSARPGLTLQGQGPAFLFTPFRLASPSLEHHAVPCTSPHHRLTVGLGSYAAGVQSMAAWGSRSQQPLPAHSGSHVHLHYSPCSLSAHCSAFVTRVPKPPAEAPPGAVAARAQSPWVCRACDSLCLSVCLSASRSYPSHVLRRPESTVICVLLAHSSWSPLG